MASHCTEVNLLLYLEKWVSYFKFNYLAHFFLSSLFEYSTESNHMVCFDFGQWVSNSTMVQ